MADETKKDDIFADKKISGLPAYPKWVHTPTGEKYPDGSDIVTSVLVQNADEHKLAFTAQKGVGKKNW